MLSGKRVVIMARKKVVIVIVEGPSDEDALGVLFERFFDKNTVRVKVIHGDITTEKSVNSSNILTHVTDVVKQTLNEYKLNKSDLLRVIHLVDTDGAYAPDSAVIYDASCIKPFYSTTEIRSQNPDGIRLRNLQKKANVTKLHSTQHIWSSIPYSVFYMSCNLDHALYNKFNLTDDEKEKEALIFAKTYRDDIPAFIDFVSRSDFSVTDDYMSSWAFIKQDLHSLERHTNLGLCFLQDES